ncbi:MAG: trimethylamine methyltransferase family protein [Chloroflexota bacterium]
MNTKRPLVEYLTDAEVEGVHERSLHILENTGIEVDHQQGLELLDQAGAAVDHETRRVRIPRQLVEQALDTVPSGFTLAARDPDKDCPLVQGGRPYSRNGGGADFTLDLESGEFRPLMKADMKGYYALMDALDGISFIAPVFGQDLPDVGRDIEMLRIALSHTDKHVHMRTYTGETLRHMLEMAAIVAGGKEQLKERPIVSLLEAPISPLKFIDVAVDALLLCGEYGIPLDVCVMPIAGGTGPMTMAGNVQLFNAEFLGGLVISQLANPGAPLQYAPRPMAMDMRSGFSLAGSVELGIMAAAGAQMARFYQVPVSLHGPWTDAVTHDAQSLLERMYMTTMAAMAGANVLVGAGMMQQSLSISHEQLVMDDEVNRIAFRAVEGLQKDEERWAMEAIARVGPGGNFLADDHTFKFLRGERYEPAILYRGARDEWEKGGSKTLVDRARDRARTILASHEPEPLPEDLARAVDDYADEAMASLEE